MRESINERLQYMSNDKPAQRYLRRLAALNKRADFLSHRISEAEKSGKDLSFDKQELSAVVWCINIIEENPDIAMRTLRSQAPRQIIN